MVSTDIAVWIGTILYFAWFSQLYKRNKVSEFAEYLLVGLSSAQVTIMAFEGLVGTVRQSLSANDFLILIPLLLGIALFGRLVSGYGWVGRWSIALIVGVSAAMATRGAIESEVYSQILPTIKNFIVPGNIFETFNGVVIMVGMITTIMYFTFFIEHQGQIGGIVGKFSYWGRAFMMLFFGASVGQMYVNRANYLIGIAKHILVITLGIRL